MIVISGALVLVALVLLVIGLVTTSLPFVYASIAVSVVSFAFLLVGILQRRKEKLPDETAVASVPTSAPAVAPAPASAVTPLEPAAEAATEPLPESLLKSLPESSPESSPVASPESSPRLAELAAPEPAAVPVEPEPARAALANAALANAALADAVPSASGVLVVPGRPRYHVAGCRYLSGRQPDRMDVQAARRDGFTACGVCRPDDLLAEGTVAEPQLDPDRQPAPQPDPDPQPVPEQVVAARRTTRAAPAKAPGGLPTLGASTRRTATVPPLLPAGEAAAAPASAGLRRDSVVVIPDRGRFHRADCRYVRGADNAQSMSKAQAARQGYVACGVCLP